MNSGYGRRGTGRYRCCGVGRQSLISSVRGHEVLKVGDAGSELLFLRHGGILFGGESETFGESQKLIESGRARENESCRI